MALRSINNFLTALSVGLANTDTEMGIPNAMAQWLQDAVFDNTDTILMTIESGNTREVVECTAQTQDGVSSGVASVDITRAVEDVSSAAATAKTFNAGAKVEHRLTAGDVQDNLRGGGGGGAAFETYYDETGGETDITLTAGLPMVVFSNASGACVYDFQCALVADAVYMATIVVGKYGPGGTADAKVNGSTFFHAEINSGDAPVGYPGGVVRVWIRVSADGSEIVYGVKEHQT